MRIYILFFLMVVNGRIGFTQSDYKDQYLGWIKRINTAEPAKPVKYDNRSFTSAQLSTCNYFINWVQLSYIPKGGLGEGKKTANEKLGLYNSYTASLHDYYGAVLPTYLFLKKKAGGGWTPENNLGLFIRVIVNGLVGDHVDVISSRDNYYFYIPQTETTDTYYRAYEQFMGFSKHPVLSKYIHFYQPASIRFLAQYNVILSKKNEIPWIQITKGEFLEALGKSIERTHQESLAKINDDYNEKRKQSFLADEEALYKKRLSILSQQLEKYKNRLTEKATMYTEQPSVHLENVPDIFEGNGGYNRKIPIYKYDPVKVAEIKKGSVKWITLSWGGGNMEDEPFKNMQASMLNNINYDYIYQYFFEKEKINGRTYQPAHAPETSEELSVLPESAITLKQKNEPGTFLFEDFSNTMQGKSPVNWKSENNVLGEPVKTALRPDKSGNCAVIRGQKMEWKEKITLPENFTFSCDIGVPKNFTWGAKRLVIKFGNSKESFEVSMRPGFDGRPGFLYAGESEFGSVILQPGSLNKASEIPMPGFSNNNTFNQIQLEVSKKGTALELRLDGKTVYSQPAAFTTAGIKIQGLTFSHSRSDTEQEKYYISNLLIRKND